MTDVEGLNPCEDEIAIVGVGCRFPGANDLDEFWHILVSGENHVKDIPPERWNNDAYYDKDKTAAGKIYITKAGLIDGHDEFDPLPFGISNAEAQRMDPQQRFVLECVHMAMEDGGISKAAINGTDTGVYIGFMNDDYKAIFKSNHTEDNSYSATGFSPTIIANRVSYVYNLLGPSQIIDTACSSALVAVHSARQAILAGDCEMAICGGVSSIISPETFIPLCKSRLLSAVGQCQTFCDSADGYARSEGCGIVILKRLNQAMKDGNKIWATLKTAVNQDGHTVHPITCPSADQHIQLLEKCYKVSFGASCGDQYSASQVDPLSVQYIEAHGTGTVVGDPIETDALGRFFFKHRRHVKDLEHLFIGSVKTNIGHTESAAGIAGLIKTLLMMRHGKLVPSLHIKSDMSNLHPAIKLIENGIEVVTKVQEWKLNEYGNRIGCVNSFGFGGTNSHCVLLQRQSFTSINLNHECQNSLEPCFVTVSAEDIKRLQYTLESFKHDLLTTTDSLKSISFTSTCLRERLSFRVCFSVSSLQELMQKVGKIKVTDKDPKKKTNIVFLFGGTGTTWKGMCSELISNDQSFRKAIETLDIYLKPLIGFSMVQTFQDPNKEYSEPFVNHIALFSAQVGLTEMLRGFGVLPDSVIGLSVGEVAAAYASGVLDIKSAVEVIYFRSKYLTECRGGKMLVVKNINVNTIEMLCQKYDRKVTVALYLSPFACTISGDSDKMDNMKEEIQAIKTEGHVFMKELPFHYAYHSHKVDPCLSDVRESLGELKPCDKHTRIFSSVTGNIATENDFQTGEYWVRNIRQPVQVNKTVQAAIQTDKKNILIEIGPHPFIGPHINDIFRNLEVAHICLSSMREKAELQQRNAIVAELYENGVNIQWHQESNMSYPSTIPKYKFQRRKILFLPDDVKRQFREGISPSSGNEHMFVQNSTKEAMDYQLDILKDKTPFVFDHFLKGKVLVPAATYVEAAFAISQKKDMTPLTNAEISLEFMNTFYPKDKCESRIDCKVNKMSESLEILFLHDDKILCKAKAVKRQDHVSKQICVESIKENSTAFLSKREVYASLEKFGYRYGHSLSLIEHAWYTDQECLAELSVPENLVNEFNNTHIHPAILDSVFQMPGILNQSFVTSNPVFPKRVNSVRISGKPCQKLFCYAVGTERYHGQFHVNALLLDSNGNSLCEIRDFTITEVDNKHDLHNLAYTLEWRPLKRNDKENKPSISIKCIVWCTDSAKNIIEPLCEDLKPTFYVMESDGTLKVSGLEDAMKDMHSGLYGSMIFAPFFNVDLNTDTSDVIYRACKQTLLCLKCILHSLSEKSIAVPLFVITSNTQCRENQSTVLSNVCGSELWGFVRSVSQENYHLDIRLVDIGSEESDKATFSQIIGNSFPDESELRLEGSQIFVNRLQPHSQFLHHNVKKQIRLQDSDEVSLRSSLPREMYSPFLKSCRAETSVAPVTNDTVTLRLKSVCIHDEGVYPVTIASGEAIYQVWPELSVDGFQSVCIEGTGVDESSSESSIYFCFPVQVATHVTIPKSFTFVQSEVPSYIPGLLTSSVVLCFLHSKAKSNAELCICTDDENKNVCLQLLQAIRGKKDIFFMKKTDVVKKSLDPNRHLVKGTQSVMILCKLKRADMEHLLTVFPHVTEIITLHQFVPEPVQRWLFSTFPHIEVLLPRVESIFQRRKLQSLLPLTRAMLRNFAWNMGAAGKKEHISPFSLPYSQISISDYNTKRVCVQDKEIFNPNSCYIVVGGLTGLGLIVVEWIAKKHAGYIRIISRRLPSEDKLRDLQQMADETKSNIKTLRADITDNTSVRKVINEILDELPGIPIKGIFNGAGALADRRLDNMSEDELEKAILPKILGTVNLHNATKEMDLDFFVTHSSVVSVLGNRGQCNYAAGNSFIDSLAHYRHSRKMCAQSINWGPLNNIGMLENKPELKAKLLQQGINCLDKESVCLCLKQAVLSDAVQTIVASFNLSLLASNRRTPMLKELVPSCLPTKQQFGKETEYKFDTIKYGRTRETERSSLLLEVVQHVLCHVFVVSDTSILTPDLRIYELGLDSFTATNFIQTLHSQTNFNIPLEVMLSDETTILTIVTLLQQNIGKPLPKEKIGDCILDPNSTLLFTEMTSLLEFEKNTGTKSSIEVTDLKFEGIKWSHDTWKNVLNHLVFMNPALCRQIRKNDSVYEVVSLTETSANVEFHVFSKDKKNTDDPREHVSFDLASEMPIIFQIIEGASSTILRLIFHPVIADLSTHLIVCKDLLSIGLARIQKIKLPDPKRRVNVAQVLHTKVNETSYDAKTFWTRQLSDLKKPIELVSKNASNSLERSQFKLIKDHFDTEVTEDIFDFITSEKVTLFQFFMSVYQMFLYMETRRDTAIVPVIAPVDLRIHLPELKDIVGRCVNDIPHIAILEENQTFREFLHSNAERICQSISHSIYPYNMILQELPIVVLQEKINRHRLCEDNITGFGQDIKVGGFTISLNNSWTVDDLYETYFGYTVDNNSRVLLYDFGFNAGVHSFDKGKTMLTRMMILLEKCIKLPDEEVCTLIEEMPLDID